MDGKIQSNELNRTDLSSESISGQGQSLLCFIFTWLGKYFSFVCINHINISTFQLDYKNSCQPCPEFWQYNLSINKISMSCPVFVVSPSLVSFCPELKPNHKSGVFQCQMLRTNSRVQGEDFNVRNVPGPYLVTEYDGGICRVRYCILTLLIIQQVIVSCLLWCLVVNLR